MQQAEEEKYFGQVPGLSDEPAGGSDRLTRCPAPSSLTGLRRRSHAVAASPGPERAASEAAPAAPPSGPGAFEMKSSYVNTLLGGMRPSADASTHHWAISTIDAHFRYFSIWVLCTWLSLVAMVYAVVPEESIVQLSGAEQRGAVMAMALIAVSFLSRVVPLFSGCHGKNHRTNMSGIFLGGLTIQIVAFCTDLLMAYFPTPVVVDPVLGTRVHVLRWCEWCPCATFMTFMMEGADLYWTADGPPPDFLRTKYLHAAAQGGSVFLGLLFPFCKNFWTWMACMLLACLLYSLNFPRMRTRQRQIPRTLRSGATLEEAERFNAAKLASRLRLICTLVWSLIVALFFVSSVLGPKFSPQGSMLRSPAATMLCECLFDVLSKVLFLVVIVDVHYAIFDPFARSERRLEELRQLMSAVWESSSDIIAISVRTGPLGGVSTMLSPAFFNLGDADGPSKRLSSQNSNSLFWRKSALFQLKDEALQLGLTQKLNDIEKSDTIVTPEMIFNVDFSDFSTAESLSGGLMNDIEFESKSDALRAIADVVVKAWSCRERELVFSHNLKWVRSKDGKELQVCTEAKVSRLDENALLVIVRDISERVKMFETEKQILFETTSRQKDAEANRFTRHEVKNGLLAAIGLYESLCEAQGSQLMDIGVLSQEGPFKTGNSEVSDKVVRCMNELGKSLHDTLDTILVEAMTRDLIHDLYRPHRERVNMTSVLRGPSGGHPFDAGEASRALNRFPLITRPSPLPSFYFDPQLLRYLHRHALSNACKYGKTGAVVLTEILYDATLMQMQINVINLPGEFHDRLLKMGRKAEEAVFAKGKQVHEHFRNDSDSLLTKKSDLAAIPGDGGWIVQKCAKILKGSVSIKFEETRTVFTLNMPAKPYGKVKIRTPQDFKNFRLPTGIWGIAIDDSKIQQKLLAKFFVYAGIPEARIKVFGKNSEEIMGFVDYVVNFMDEHMGQQILMIADENLEVSDEASCHRTISGSQLVENIRLRLLPEQERSLFALIRSANDSGSDVAIYNARANGFLPKAPIKKSNVLETLAPLWYARYPPESHLDDDQSRLTRSDSFSSLESSSSLNEAIATTPVELIQIVKEIDELFSRGSILNNWQKAWEKLHALKGDLLTLKVGSAVISAVGVINSFHDLHTELELVERWNVLRQLISSLTETN